MRALRAHALTAGLALGAALAAQDPAGDPTIELVVAQSALRAHLPAVSWLCSSALPARAEWPSGLRPEDSIVVRLGPAGLSIRPNRVLLPSRAVLLGSIEWPDGPRILCSCSADGVEDWFVPRVVTLTFEWHALLDRLQAERTNCIRTVDLPVAVGHLLGANALGDPLREPVQFGAALCGEVTWSSWWTPEHLRVRGRSGGGLLLPATLLALSKRLGNGAVSTLPLRAFAARDGDREEAVRQMSRSGALQSRDVLRAMLHGPDALRLTAIDSLVRLEDVESLPAIVQAAQLEMPLAAVAAIDAVATLWPRATEATRQATRSALQKSDVDTLRKLGGTGAGAGEPTLRPISNSRSPAGIGDALVVRRWPLMLVLFVLGTGLFGLWLRERAAVSASAGVGSRTLRRPAGNR